MQKEDKNGVTNILVHVLVVPGHNPKASFTPSAGSAGSVEALHYSLLQAAALQLYGGK